MSYVRKSINQLLRSVRRLSGVADQINPVPEETRVCELAQSSPCCIFGLRIIKAYEMICGIHIRSGKCTCTFI